MPSKWRRLRARRAATAVVVALTAACGLTYAGLSGVGGDRPGTGGGPVRPAAPVTEVEATSRAARSGTPVEVTALRTAYETTWARPDGLLQRRVHATPFRAKVDGRWQPIDTTLARTRDGWSPRATNVRLTFSAGARSDGTHADRGTGTRRLSLLDADSATGNDLVSLTVSGHTIQLTWPGAIPAPVIDDSRALYPDILPGADLVLTADDGGFSQLLVVKNRQAAADPRVARLTYGLTSPDLDFSLDPTTGIVTGRDADGEEQAFSPTPLMWDSSGTPALTDSQAGTSASPTAEESLSGDASAPPEDTESPTGASPEPSDTLDDSDDGDVDNETLQDATDEAPVPSDGESESVAPSVPPEPAPEPTHTGAAATLDLSSLAGPQPDSGGTLVAADLDGTTWSLTPDQEFLTDPDTVYPVFIDPSVSKHTNDWTTAYSRHPNANFYNGRNFNKGTHEARVGFESDTWGTSRSFFSIDWNPDLKGATVISAKLHALETYSWSCNPRTMNVYLTGAISNKTTWRNAPKMTAANKLASKSFAHGYRSSSCPDDHEVFDVKPAAQKAISHGWEALTIGLRAGDENSAYSWKKFQADDDYGPYVDLVYNRPPAAPSHLDLDPDLSCDTSSPYVNVGADSITFWANSSDKDANLDSLRFELWPTGGSGNLLGSRTKVTVGSQTDSARVHTDPFSTGGLKNGIKYSWRVKAVDKRGAASGYTPTRTPCRFVFDSSRPTPPVVTSATFPDADAKDDGFNNADEDSTWSTVKFGTAGSFTFKASQTDVVKYEYGFNSASYSGSVTRANGASTSTTTTFSGSDARPPLAGPNVLYVRAVDDAGNPSDPRKYFFYVTPRDIADAPGDFTGDGFPDLMVIDGNGNLRMYPDKGTTDTTKGTGALGYSMSGAYQENSDKDPNGDELPLYSRPSSGYWKNTILAHLGDVYGGDGLQDLVAVREGKLWVYPGDGYGAVDVGKRHEILLPTGAPDPATITQIVSAGDATGDGKPDFFLTVGDTMWVLTGYNGATIDEARRLSGSAWSDRDFVTAQDISGDGVTDFVYRSDASGGLLLRKGIKDTASGGVSLSSLASGAASSGGADTTYGASGWGSSSVRLLFGTPDANGDNIPDIWALRVDGTVRFFAGSRTALSGSGTEIVGNSNGVGWKNKMAVG
ncbi:DNRLRE domain-containing protein [Streptomyces sp. NPDC059980]|uniref:DNRLRE domain-containing protein n=1 Tax=Streptomyces sp. NPDC059980 TaxID=3347022 RepID=UPI0036A9D203